MSMKVLIILSLVAAASAVPAPTPTFPLPSINLNGILNIGVSDFGTGLRSLLNNIIGTKHVGKNNLNTILGIKVKDFYGVCDLTTQLVASLGDTIDASIRGLGNLISRVVFCLLRIIICFLGNGGSNPVCNYNINTLVGVSASASINIQALIKLYGLTNVKANVNALLLKYTYGGGISKCRGSTRGIFQLAIDLADKLDLVISGKGSIVKADIRFLFRKISILIGLIANSRSSGLGVTILKNYIPTCNKYLKLAGYVDIGDTNEVSIAIDLGNEDNGPWAIADVDVSADVNVSLGGLISGVLKGVLGVTRLATKLINDIASSVVNSINSVFNLALKIVLGIGGALDATIAGLGSLVVRIVAGLLRIVLCFIGTGKYGVCSSSWDRQVGVTGDVTSIQLVLKLYGLINVRAQVDQYIKKYNSIVGQGSNTGSITILFRSAVALADIVDAGKWDKNIVVTVLRHATYCLGAIGNSNAKGVGTKVCNKFIPACNKYLTAEGYIGFGNSEADIIKVVEGANDDDYTWTADITIGDNRTGFISAADAGITVSIGVSGGGSSGGSGGGSTGGSGGISVGGSTGGSVGGLLGGIIKGVFGTIKGVTNLALGALNTIVNIKIKALSDVFSLILNLSLVLRVTLDNLVFGLGSLFTRLIACILKIAICVKGYPGDRGICTPEWNNKWGIKGDAKTAAALIVLFKLGNAQNEYNSYVSKCTNGRGINSTTGSRRTVLEKISLLISIIINSEKISKSSVTDTFVILTTISASIGNSQKRDSGKEITQQIVPQCGEWFKKEGYADITVQINVIINECAKSNGDQNNWNGGDTTPSSGGGNTTPSSGGGNTTPSSGGGNTTPSSGGGNTTPSSGGSNTTPSSGGGNTTPSSGGGNTTPSSGGGSTTPTSGGDDNTETTPSDNDSTTQSSGGGDTTPSSGGDYNTDTTPSSDTDSTTQSSGGGDTTPSSGGDYNTDTTPSSDTDSTTQSSGGGDTTPSSGGDYNTDTTPSSDTESTTQASGGDDNTETTPSSDNDSTTSSSGGGYTTQSSGGDSTTQSSGGDSTTQSSGGDSTTQSSGGGSTTKSPGGGNTTPSSGGGNTTPSSGGGNTPTGPVTSDNCGIIISGAIKVIPGVTKLSSISIKELISIKIRTYVDIINLTTNLTLALGGIIDLLFSGLGSILVRIVAVIFKIGYCVNGFGTDRSICTKEWNAKWGVVGESSSAADLYALYRVNNWKSEVNTIISTITNGKGLSSTTGVRNFVLQKILDLGDIISSGNVTKQQFSLVFIYVVSIFGSITNSYTRGSGTDIAQKIIPVCGPYFVKQGFPDVRTDIKTVVNTINVGNTDKIDWNTIQSGSNTKENQLVTDVKDAFNGAKDSTNVNKVSVTAVLNLEVPINLDGVLNFGIKTILGLGGILDVFISGLGSLLVRIVGGLIHYIVAILGASRNAKSFVSQKAYYAIFGLNVSAKLTTWAEVSAAFQITKATSDLDIILNTYTKNKGLSVLNEVEKLFFDLGYSLCALTGQGTSIKESVLTVVLRVVITALAGFANSCKANLGKSIVDTFVPVCSSYLAKENYPVLTTQTATIYKSIERCNNVKVPWISKTTVVNN